MEEKIDKRLHLILCRNSGSIQFFYLILLTHYVWKIIY